jgi:glycosyltransferase involved in cell wall biosynthesis
MAIHSKVSIVLTSYNHAKYLRESINSVLNQTFTDFELIIWDDASTDESWEIISSYADPRLRSFRSKTPNIVAHVRDVISGMVVGEYIAIHHSDDVWEPDKLEKQVGFLDANPQIGAVFSWAQIIDENGQPFQDKSHYYYKIFEQPNRTRHEWLNFFFHHGNALCHPSLLIRKECYEACGLYRYGLAQLPDFDMWVRLCMKYEIHVMPEKLLRFRIRSNEVNASGIRPDTRIRGQFEFLQVLGNFRNIPTLQELVRIFPDAERYITPHGYDLDFALGRIALASETNQLTALFGLNTLFEIFNTPSRKEQIEELYGFSQSDFIALTGQHDVFLVERSAQLTTQVGELTTQVDELTEELRKLNLEVVERDTRIATLQLNLSSASTTLAEIYASKGWRLLTPLRWLRRQQIRASQLLKAALLLLAHPRDILALLRNALKVWRREGWVGLKSSIRFYINYYLETNTADRTIRDHSLYHYLRSGKKDMLPYVNSSPESYTPKVSVIVPNFNHSEYLEERLNSIYEQTYQNFEVILLDDCSTDNSPSILKKYAEKHADRTRCYFNEVNSGSPFAQWEKGISLAEGDLIWIAESDDFCEKNFLEKLVPLFCNDSILLSYAHPIFVNEKGKQHIFAFERYVGQIDLQKWRTSYIETAHNEVNAALGLLNTIPNVSGALFRKLDHHFFLFGDPQWKKMRVCGDWLFYLHLIRGGAIAYNRDTHNYYRIYETSTSKKTHSREVYYQEHEQVAMAIVGLYKVPGNLLSKLQARLLDFYFKNVEDGSAEKFDALFNIEKITRCLQTRKPNVLMATYGLAFGGGEIFPVQLANALYKAGAAVTLFNGGYEPTQAGVRKMLLPQIAILTNHAGFPVNEMLEKFGIEVIHSQHASMDNYFAVARRITSTGIKHVVTMHGMYEMMDDFMHNTAAIRGSVEHWVYTADKNVVPFTKHGLYNAEKFTKIENGLPTPIVNKMDLGSLGITADSFTACLASRALPDKGWLEAIEATKKAREVTSKDVHLLLIGEGPVYELLRNEQQPEFIHLLGYIANLDDYIASSQLGLLPTYFKGESFPLILIQFFMAELPVIATNHAEISRMAKINEDQTGAMLIELHNNKVDPDDLAQAMIRMITDQDHYKKYAYGARLLKNRFDIDNIAQQYLTVYQRTLGYKL